MTPEKLGSFLHHCTSRKLSRLGLSLHAVAVKTGNRADIVVSNHVLNFYAKCGRIESAHQVFDEMPQRNLVTWSAMVSGYDQSNRPHSALQVFSRMQNCYQPNEFVFASALSSCSAVKDLHLGQQIHAQALKSSYASVSFVRSSLISMYMKCGMCDDASLMFTDSKPNSSTLVAYNIAIAGLVENKQQDKGIEMFTAMCRQSLVPDRFTFAGLLGPGEPIYDLSVVMQLHCQMVKLGLDSMAFSGNVLITLYSKFNLMEESENAFNSIEKRDAISWNTAISALCRFEEYSDALNVFREMVTENNASPDNFTYTSALSAAAGLASMRNGKEIHSRLTRTWPDWDIGVGNALINMYAKSGSISSACTIFEKMDIRNLISWNTIIAAFANHGLAERAFALFEEMMRTAIEPDSVTFLELLTACNHSGLVDEGRAVFNSMSEVYGIDPDVEHLCCLVNLLGRTGRVTEAEEYMRQYSIGDNEALLGSFFSAWRINGVVTPGEQIALSNR